MSEKPLTRSDIVREGRWLLILIWIWQDEADIDRYFELARILFGMIFVEHNTGKLADPLLCRPSWANLPLAKAVFVLAKAQGFQRGEGSQLATKLCHAKHTHNHYPVINLMVIQGVHPRVAPRHVPHLIALVA